MLINMIKKIFNPKPQSDAAFVKIGELVIAMTRKNNIPLAHEFSIFIPRVEIRHKYYHNNQLSYEKEMIFNSVTVVHAPRPEQIEDTN